MKADTTSGVHCNKSAASPSNPRVQTHFPSGHVEWFVLAFAMMGFLNKFMDAATHSTVVASITLATHSRGLRSASIMRLCTLHVATTADLTLATSQSP
jgi:hypothetical protein